MTAATLNPYNPVVIPNAMPMPQSFDRLFNLAKKTGNSLIVYDRAGGEHLVVMGVDEYEDLIDRQEDDFCVDDDHSEWVKDTFDNEPADVATEVPDVRELSEVELIDKINHDIAIWRSGREVDQTLTDAELEDEQDLADEREAQDDWHQAGAVLSKLRPEFQPESNVRGGEYPAFFTPPAGHQTEESTTEPVPFVEHPEASPEGDDLDDEPIFFEEPVE